MADKEEETSPVTGNETSPNTFWKGLAELLKAHPDVLYSLPQMCEKFAEIDWKNTTVAEQQAPYTCRQEELTVIDKRKDANVKKHFDKQTAIDRVRITTLKRQSKQKDREIELLKKKNDKLNTETQIEDGKLKECFERCASLERKLGEKEKEVTFANKERETLEIELEKRKEKNELMDKKNEELKTELEIENKHLKEFSERNKQLKEQCRELLKQKDQELNKLKNRLAYLSEKQVMRDQRQVEDTTASNRPSEVEKDFSAFCDADRVDACDKLLKIYGSEEEIDVKINYPRLACMIFETAYEEMKEAREAVAELFEKIMKNMTASAPVKAQEYCLWKEKGEEVPFLMALDLTVSPRHVRKQIDVLDTLMLSLKETSHVCDLTPLQPKVTSKVMEKWKAWLTKERSCTFSSSEQLLGQLNDYIQACIRLSWRIVTQVPPMMLEYQSSILRNIHTNRGYNVSAERRRTMQPEDEQNLGEENSIACYLWPGLFDGGGRLIRAGEVLCYREKVTMT